jgi:hypothetical protein
MGQMKRLNAILSAGLALFSGNLGYARVSATLSVSAGASEFSINVNDGFINVICIRRCRANAHFREALIGVPLGIIQQSDKMDSATIISATGSHYHVTVIYFTDRRVIKIFDKYTKSIPKLEVDDDANPEIDIISDKENFKHNDNPSLHQIWVEEDDKFRMKSEYLK